MIRRPRHDETEQDLMKQEEEFLKAQGKGSLKRNISNNDVEKQESKRTGMVGHVMERKVTHFTDGRSNVSKPEDGFPETFVVTESGRRTGKMSLFAMQLAKNKNLHQEDMKTETVLESTSNVSSGSVTDEIHAENMNILSQMSEKDILEEQARLHQTLRPDLIQFLKNRKKVGVVKVVEEKMEVVEQSMEMGCEQGLHMDILEKDKLEWTGDLPDCKALEPGEEYSARFDFDGDLQPFKVDVDVRKALNHHGDEAERPGYTIQELYQLCRSSVLQQRVLALDTLANVIRKTKNGYYDACFDNQLLHKLVDSDLFFLLRFSIDERALVPVAMKCLHHLVGNASDEACLDRLQGVLERDEQPMLAGPADATAAEEKELKDHVVIARDLVKGILRTDLLHRMAYIGTEMDPSRETAGFIIETVLRVARHSPEAVVKAARLLHFAHGLLTSDTPSHQAVKLFRLLASHSKQVASFLLSEYPMGILLGFIDADTHPRLPPHQFSLLKLESLRLWTCFLRHDLMTDAYAAYTPHLTRLLRFYLEKLDFGCESEFDFELFSALVTLARSSATPPDPNITHLLQSCLEKWLKQLTRGAEFDFSSLKALGTAFRYFSSLFTKFGVTDSAVQFIRTINASLVDFFSSPTFARLALNLTRFSHVLHFEESSRDPSNHPSLCSVYRGGVEYLKIVQKESPFGLFIPLVAYLNTVYNVIHDSSVVIQAFLDHENIVKYLGRIEEHTKRSDNWFMGYEVEMLVGVLSCFGAGGKDPMGLGFHMLPFIRRYSVHVSKVLSVLCDESYWGVDVFDTYSKRFVPASTCVPSFKTDLMPVSWVYEPLQALDCSGTTQVLKFLSVLIAKRPGLLSCVTVTERFYFLCSVFLTDSNVFDDQVIANLTPSFRDVIENQEGLDLNIKVAERKSFYDLYTSLLTQYAGVSYGAELFGSFVTLPLQNRFDVSYRKLVWSEYIHVVKVLNMPFPCPYFPSLEAFVQPVEEDASLLTTYLNSLEHNVITRRRNPFVFEMTLSNVRAFIRQYPNEQLAKYLLKKLNGSKNNELKAEFVEELQSYK